MSGKVKIQHYVPRMYLKRFSPDPKRICVWNLMKDEILTRQQPENYNWYVGTVSRIQQFLNDFFV